MRLYLTGFVVAVAAGAPPAAAQDVWDDPGGIETAFTYEAAAIAAPDADEPYLFLLRGSFEADYVLQNGAEIGFRTSAGLERDYPARAGFSGQVGPAQPVSTPSGAFSGLARGPGGEDAGARGRIENAYIYIQGGYGELRLGRDEGVASRFFEGAPTLFRYASLANPALDPTGVTFARTDHDLTGPASKASYATPRILGVRAGVSLTPEADAGGLDRDPVRTLAGAPQPSIENAVEVALNVSRRLPRSGARLRAGAAYSEADTGLPALPGVYDKVETWSVGGSVELSSLAFGASYLASNNGFASAPGDYTALSAAFRTTIGKYDAGLDVTDTEDEAIGVESKTYGVSVGRGLTKNLRVVGGWQWRDTRYTGNPFSVISSSRDRRDGIVIEITLSG